MPSSIYGSLSPRQGPTSPTTNTANDDNSGLTQSLSQLSLTNEPKTLRPIPQARNSSVTPAKLPPPRRSSSASPHPRTPSRSPSNGPGSRRASHAGTPPLLRKASMNSLHSANGTGPARSSARRSSATQILPMSPTASTPPEEKPPVTAKTIASDYFAAELDTHHGPSASLSTDTVVILNDAVYGHRFSRPRTSRNALSTIVERPERIKAAVLGISTAYVRLGGRHCQGSLPIHPKRNVLDIDSIPFRIQKTTRQLSLLSPAVTNVHGTKWMEELKLMCDSAESILAMGGKELQRPDIPRGPDHPAAHKLHEGDLYLCEESLAAMQGALGAVCEAVDTVFGPGPRKAFVGVRPPGHHCSDSHPSGFCWVNNVHVGIMHGALQHGLTHAAIIDFDLHHGDGSQAITWQHNSRANTANKTHAPWKRTSIGYFSLHDINSYPCEMGDEEKVKNASLCIDNAHGQSIWNVHLQSWKTEQDFWKLYETTYAVLLDKTRTYLKNEAAKLQAANQIPKAAIFFSAGFDASEWESAGMQRHQVNVPTEFYARLTQDVVKLAGEVGLAVDGRVISVLEGGYSDRALCSGILSHLSGMVGSQSPVKTEQESGGLAYEMGQRIGAVSLDGVPAATNSLAPAYPYDPSWWASGQLDLLEEPEEAPAVPRKPRTTTPPTYSSPTQSSTARVVDPVRMKNSLSSLYTGYPKAIQRPPSPPPPEISWDTAAKELCKTLIPSDRQTDSCTAEDLNAEASRARRDRQSILLGCPPPTPSGSDRPSSKMSLRERRSRPIGPIDEEMSEVLPKTRRTQTSTPMTSPAKATRGTPQPIGAQSARRSSRRLSSTSTNLSPPREEPPPVPPIPATAPVPRRTTSRPNSRAGRTQSSNKVPVKKEPGVTSRAGPAPKVTQSARRASTPARGAKQTIVGADTPTPATGLPRNTVGDNVKSDVDNLANGVKKIKINLITKSQKDAKQRAKASETKAPGRPVKKDPSIVKSEKPPTPDGMSSIPKASEEPAGHTQLGSAACQPPVPQTPSLTGGLSTPVDELYTSSTSSPTPAPSIPAGSSPDVPYVTIQPASDAGDVFIPYQPEGPEPVTLGQQEPLKWLPPNIPTPSASTPATTPAPTPVKPQNNLFHYTSGIPFAPRSDKPAQQVREPGTTSHPVDSTRPGVNSRPQTSWEPPKTSHN